MVTGGVWRNNPAPAAHVEKAVEKMLGIAGAQSEPFALSLSKGELAKTCFDRLSTNGSGAILA
jgi:hypothetical protein